MTGHPLSPAERLRDTLAARLGLNFDDSKLDFLGEVLARRVAATRLGEASYLDRLALDTDMEEMGALARELTVPETYFFRHMAQFHILRETALPAALEAAGGSRPVRILSAGCASGEEAYSIAILAREMGLRPEAISIRAVDINPAPLKKARAGRYSSWVLRETPADLRDRWFKRDGQDFLIDEDIRRAVTFEQKNLTDPDNGIWLQQSYDIIFSRNAIMYLTVEKMRQVVGLIEQALVPGGHFFLGHAETLRGLSENFTLCQGHGAFYYRRSGEPRVAKGKMLRTAADSPKGAAIPVDAPPLDWMEAIGRASRQIDRLAQGGPEKPAGKPPAETARVIKAAQTLAEEERFAEALEALDSCLATGADNPQLRLLRAVLLIHSGRTAEAETAAESLLDDGEAQAGAHHVLALCREKAGDLDMACEHDRAAAYADASFAMPRLHLGLLAKRAGNPAEMQRELAQAQFLLRREDASRLAMFGGGFTRQALIDLCATTIETGSRE